MLHLGHCVSLLLLDNQTEMSEAMKGHWLIYIHILVKKKNSQKEVWINEVIFLYIKINNFQSNYILNCIEILRVFFIYLICYKVGLIAPAKFRIMPKLSSKNILDFLFFQLFLDYFLNQISKFYSVLDNQICFRPYINNFV